MNNSIPKLIATMNEVTARLNVGGYDAITEDDSAFIKAFLDFFPPGTPEGEVIATTFPAESTEWADEIDAGQRPDTNP